MSLIKQINLNNIKTNDEFHQAFANLYFESTFKVVKAIQEISSVNSFSSQVKIKLPRKEQLIMFCYKKIVNKEEETITLILSNNKRKVVVTNFKEEDKVHYEFFNLQDAKEEQVDFISRINKEWQEYLSDSPFHILVYAQGEDVNDTLDIFKTLTFIESSHIRTVEGQYKNPYVINEYMFSILFRGIEGEIGTAPGFNSKAKNKKQ
ncbi:hypothetical protein U8V72_23065 [Priestia filamentosa]|uniref:hypothetical protein n=1 Tax=Priestia filamentosa TaxID=1402861 RepID=UPI0039783DE6